MELNGKGEVAPGGSWDGPKLDGREVPIQNFSAGQGIAEVLQASLCGQGRAGPRSGRGFIMSTRMKQASLTAPHPPALVNPLPHSTLAWSQKIPR